MAGLVRPTRHPARTRHMTAPVYDEHNESCAGRVRTQVADVTLFRPGRRRARSQAVAREAALPTSAPEDRFATLVAIPSPEAHRLDRATLEAQLLSLLPQVDRMVVFLARRHGIRGADVDDLSQCVKLRLVEDDYAILRKFRGESDIKTFLRAVVARMVQDYRIKRYGRWRPSAAALRLGRVALLLESLIYRRGCSLAEAREILRAAGETTVNERELAKILARLPRRLVAQPIEANEIPLSEQDTSLGADDLVEHAGNLATRQRIESALRRALDGLDPDARCMIVLHYWQNMSVANIARALNVPQKPLYRVLERAEKAVHRALLESGISATDTHDMLDADN